MKSGMVFSEDWFSAPFVTSTCQENGEFEQLDWEDLSCVLRRFRKFKPKLNKVLLKQRQRNDMTALK